MKTKVKRTEGYVPMALRQVWEWKDAIYQETKHLPTREALRYIMKEAHKVAVEQGFATATPARMAENPGKYTARRKK